jgi:hypothetical protein
VRVLGIWCEVSNPSRRRVEVSFFVLSSEIEDRGEGEVTTGRSTKRPFKSYKDSKITL